MERNPLPGCIASIIFVSLIMLAVVGGCSFVSYNVATIADSVGATRQVSISEVQATKRTGIEWDARVEMERIKADATKKTDGTFILFYLVRFCLWFAVLYGAWLIYEKVRGHEPTVTPSTDG